MAIYSFLAVLGRLIFGAYFLLNAWNHFSRSKNMTAYASSKGVPMPSAAVLGGGVLLLIGGLSFVFNYHLEIGTWALIIFLVPVTFKMHAFWKISDQQARLVELVNFYKNMALLGAVLMTF